MRININGTVVSDAAGRIYDWLGFPYTSPSKVRSELEKANGGDIELYVNSAGGHVVDASEIYTDLKEYPGKVTAKVTGLAASAASWIVMAADDIKMSPTSLMMLHNSRCKAEGDYGVMDNASDMLTQTDGAIRSAYMLKTGKSEDEIKNLMEETTWFNATRAMEEGLIDGVMFDEAMSPEQMVNSLIPRSGLENIAQLMGNEKERGTTVGGKEQSVEPKVENTEAKNEKITIEDLKNDYREIYDEVYNLGVNDERTRIKNIEDLGVIRNEELINKAKFENPVNAETLAVEIIKSQKNSNAAMLENMVKDKEDLVIDNTANPALNSEQENTDELAKTLVDMLNERRQ